jgi:hypothetical protein
MKAQIKGRGSVNVPSSEGTHIPQSAMLDEYGAIAIS